MARSRDSEEVENTHPEEGNSMGYRSNLDEADLERLRLSYPTSAEFSMRLPTPEENCPPSVRPGCAIFAEHFKSGLQFPLTSFGMTFLGENRVSPGQLHPHAWAQIVAFSVWCYVKGVNPSTELFSCFFRIRRNRAVAGGFSLQRLAGTYKLFVDMPNKLHNYERSWLVVDVPYDWPAPAMWHWSELRQGLVATPRASTLRRKYYNLLERLKPAAPIDLEVLLTSKNVASAGWGLPFFLVQESHARLLAWENSQGDASHSDTDNSGGSSSSSSPSSSEDRPERVIGFGQGVGADFSSLAVPSSGVSVFSPPCESFPVPTAISLASLHISNFFGSSHPPVSVVPQESSKPPEGNS